MDVSPFAIEHFRKSGAAASGRCKRPHGQAVGSGWLWRDDELLKFFSPRIAPPLAPVCPTARPVSQTGGNAPQFLLQL